ncbi:MAG: hypothetical protein ACTSPV_16935 [Candidatus Hodarchaeales archaeon]
MVRKRRRILFFVLFVGLFGLSITNTSLVTAVSRIDLYFDVIITDAYYCDLDNDVLEDDILISADLDFWFNTREYSIVSYLAYLELETPNSSMVFYAEYDYYKRDYHMIFHLVDSVDVAGWYVARLTVCLTDSYGCISYLVINDDIVIFDPPEVGNGLPGGTLYIG